MKLKFIHGLLVGTIAVLGGISLIGGTQACAEEASTPQNDNLPVVGLGINPVSQTIQISPSSTYDNVFKVTNNSDGETTARIHVAPYSYLYNEDKDLYELVYHHENSFTQITHWIEIKDKFGNYVKEATFSLEAHEELEIEYRIVSPENIPAGGQYAVIIAQTSTNNSITSGIKTEAGVGMIVRGYSTEGETIISGEVRDMTINEEKGKESKIYATAKIKNVGNIDLGATGILKVTPIIGSDSYETAANSGSGMITVLPESELVLKDEWINAPEFGIYKATWTVTINGEKQVIEKIIFRNSLALIAVLIMLLTSIIIFVTIAVKKRARRRPKSVI